MNETSLPIHVGFSIQQRIARSPAEVFDAVADPEKLCAYFTRTASGPVEAGSTVHWTWDSGGEEDPRFEDVTPGESFVFRWKAQAVPDLTTCSFEFLPDGEGATMVRITEFGWEQNQESLDSSYDHVNGWTHMLLCLKAYLEYGIDLRTAPPAEE